VKTQTVKILEAALKADESIGNAERNQILRLARGDAAPAPAQNDNAKAPRLYSREQAAEMLGDKTARYVDQLAARGILKKFIPPGNTRSIGITANSLSQFLGGGA